MNNFITNIPYAIYKCSGIVPPALLSLGEQTKVIMDEFEKGWAARAAQVRIFFCGLFTRYLADFRSHCIRLLCPLTASNFLAF